MSSPDLSHYLTILGGLVVTYTIYSTLCFIWLYTKPSKLGRYLYPHPTTGAPPWALVTGASDGIGRAFAHELAARGFNVIIHGRNPAKTDSVLASLERTYPQRQFRKWIADGSYASTADLDFNDIAAQIDDVHLTVLINNAGASPRPNFGPLWEYPEKQVADTIRLNALFPVLLTRQLLPLLFRHRSPALVMFIGSMTDNGLPLLVSYSGSKRLLMTAATSLGRDMVMEGLAGQVEVLGMRVGEVTGVSNIKDEPAFGLPSAGTMARAALARVGCGRYVVVGYWQHALQQIGVDILPEWVMEWLYQKLIRERRVLEKTTGKYS